MYTWSVNYMASMPLPEQLKNKIQLFIDTGKLKDGDILPTARDLSEKLLVSIVTSKSAYKLLVDEGYIVYLKGKGYMVSNSK